MLRPLDHRSRKAGELGDLDAVGAVGRARHHLVQEHHVAVPFLHAHGGVEQPFERGGKRRQLVKMRRKQPAAAIDLMQVLEEPSTSKGEVDPSLPLSFHWRMVLATMRAWSMNN